MPMALRLVTAPAEEPVSLADAKARLRITIDDEDTDIEALIVEARAAAEAECGRAFVSQTWSLLLDGFPCGREIRVPRPPLQSVTWVKYYDADGVQQTLSSALYFTATAGDPGRIVLKETATWPATESGRPESVEVRFVAGYGGRAAVPAEVKAAVLLIVAASRDDPAGAVAIPAAARRRLDQLEYGEVR